MSALNLTYGICHSSLAPLRAEPSHSSEMVSQILFGERFSIKHFDDASHRWVFIENAWDSYTGWINVGHVTIIDKKHYSKSTKYITTDHADRLVHDSIDILHLPLGSELYQIKKAQLEWYFQEASFKGKKHKVLSQTSSEHLMPLGEEIIAYAFKYLGAPYLWGGKSLYGIDCSGLSQMAYRLANIPIPRDASQQVHVGQVVDFIEQAQAGDLAFFDNEEGRIVHVGIMIDNAHIIHATESSGGVVIDTIDNSGIISKKNKKRTHQLRIIKRIL